MRRTCAVAAVALLIGACAQAPPEPSEDTVALDFNQDDALTIALIGKSRSNPVFVAARLGAQERARELSREHGKKIRVEWVTPADEDAAEQARLVSAAVEAGAEAILISCSDAETLTPAIDAAVERGVPVMTFDSDAPDSRRFAFASIDNVEAGRRVMAALSERIGGQGKVAILAGNRAAPNLQLRMQGLREEAADHPGIEIVDTVHHEEVAEVAAQTVLRVNAEASDLRGWAMLGGWALFRTGKPRTELLALDPETMTFVAMDALPSQLHFVVAGLAPVLIAQPTYEWGTVGVETIVAKVQLGEEVPESIELDMVEVTTENVAEWGQQLRDWHFTGIPEDLGEATE